MARKHEAAKLLLEDSSLCEIAGLMGIKTRTDLKPSLPDLKIDVTDVTYAIEAFTGEGYPFEPIGDPCGG